MAKKLTLSIDESTIAAAKRYAKHHQTSLSSLVEQYFSYLTSDQIDEEKQISPIVKGLSGIIELDSNYDLKQDYGKYLAEKYLK